LAFPTSDSDCQAHDRRGKAFGDPHLGHGAVPQGVWTDGMDDVDVCVCVCLYVIYISASQTLYPNIHILGLHAHTSIHTHIYTHTINTGP
jgi:hypothetical protein